MIEVKKKGFEYICRTKNLKENDVVIGLKESEKLIGQLYPVLVDEQGNVLDGQHRLKADPNWRKEVVKGIDSERKRAMVRLHANWHRRRCHPDQILAELAKITEWKGAAPYAAFLGCSERTVQRYLPQQYKERQRILPAKRHVSLSDEKDITPYETQRRNELFEEELKKSEGFKVQELLRQSKPSTEWSKERLLDFLANCLYNNVSWHIEEPAELLNNPEIKEKCEFYLTSLELMKVSQEEILEYLRSKHISQVVNYDANIARKSREKEFKEKLESLRNSVAKLILILNDGSQIEFETSEIPKMHLASWYDYDLLYALLHKHLEKTLGFDGYGEILKEVEQQC